MTSPSAYLHAGLARYFATEEHSDCTIICGPYHFNVHKIVIGAHSEYFRTAFKAGTFQEAKTGRIELKAKEADPNGDDEDCDDPEIVKLMVHYFYHLDYVEHNEVPPKINFATHVKLHAMALKYQIPALHDLSLKNFKTDAHRYWDHDEFTQAVELIYRISLTESNPLRRFAVFILHSHCDVLGAREGFPALLRRTPDLACDLFMRDHPPEAVPCDCEVSTLTAYSCDDCRVGIQACGWCIANGSFFYCRACKGKPMISSGWSTCSDD